MNINDQIHDKIHSPDNPIAASTPNLMAVAAASAGQTKQNLPLNNIAMISRTLPRAGALCQNDQRRVEGNVFRYDFDDLPPVDRKLKPKKSIDEPVSPQHQTKPQVDRKLKPAVAAIARAATASSSNSTTQPSFMEIRTLPRYGLTNGDENMLQAAPSTQHKLQYIELDIPSSASGPTPMPKNTNSRASLISLNNNNNMYVANPVLRHHRSASMSSHKSVDSSISCPGSGVVYNYVDFVKTDAFKRILDERKKEGSK